MKKWIAWMIAVSLGLTGAVVTMAQSTEDALVDSGNQQAGLRKTLSDKPFFGTQNVLTLSGEYVNTPKEDFEQSGKWELPLTLDQLHGVVGEITFGDTTKQGEWQLSFRYKVITMDSEWQAIADSSARLTLSDRRSQVLKASYNVRNWWKLGIAAVVEDRTGADTGIDPLPLGLNSRGSLGFQIDTSLKF